MPKKCMRRPHQPHLVLYMYLLVVVCNYQCVETNCSPCNVN